MIQHGISIIENVKIMRYAKKRNIQFNVIELNESSVFDDKFIKNINIKKV